ncbi:MAG: hypothetical protein EP329_18675 [Deltaproteobacteria bacterium]|nr:MAG: hypothetical protein EP329_18675 [Deltaproteobacteria bacterium]
MSDDGFITWRGIWHGRVALHVENGTIPAGTHTAFGVDREGEATEDRVTRALESEVVTWCVGDHAARSALLERLGLSGDVDVYTEVTEPVVRASVEKPGDIDVICLPRDLRFAVALEAKCVKVSLREDDSHKVNRLGKLRGAVDQANALHGLGFHQTWLWVVLLVDGSRGNAPNPMGRRSDAAVREVAEAVQAWHLEPEVGLVFSELVQPTALSVNDQGGFMTAVIRPARPNHQGSGLCEQLEELRYARSALSVQRRDLETGR